MQGSHRTRQVHPWRAVVVAVTLGAVVSGCAFITRANVSTSGNQANNTTLNASISGDGRFVAFESIATNLVPGDTNGVSDVFVRDLVDGTTVRVSVDSSGNQANFQSWLPSISADGRSVAFRSNATNLVLGDTNLTWDIFVRDLDEGTTTRVSVDSAGNQGNDTSTDPSISGDGRRVAFTSFATNLVPGDTTVGTDIFVHDLDDSTTTRVSVDSAGNQGEISSWGPSISGNGRFVAFHSFASNLVPGDLPGVAEDVFVHDTLDATTTRVSVDSAGVAGNADSRTPSLSADGRFVAFYSGATNLVPGDTNNAWEIFVHDRQAATTVRVGVDSAGSQANSAGADGTISGDGRYVAFHSLASNLVPGDTNGVQDVFLRDLVQGTTTRVSVDQPGAQGNNISWAASISADGRYVAFLSIASNLVADDTNGKWDIFVKRSTQPTLTSVTPATGAPSSTVTVTVQGTGFIPPLTAALGGGVDVTAMNIVSEHELELEVSIAADAAPGARSVKVYDPGSLGPATGSAGQCATCFTVVAP